MKKKIVSVVLAMSMVLAGCASEKGTDATDAGTQQSMSDDSSKESSETEASNAAVEGESKNAEDASNAADSDSTEAKEEDGMSTEIVYPEIDLTAKDLPDNEAIAFIQDMKLGYNLGNTFDSYVDSGVSDDLTIETAWGNPKVTKEFISAVHENGFETIRIPVSWHNHVDDDLNINQAWLDRVQEVVDYAVEEGMFVIVDIHHDNHPEAEGLYPDAEHKQQSLEYIEKIWTQVADRFKDYDEKLIFEGMNEPRLVGHNNEWWIDPNNEDCQEAIAIINELNQKFVDVVRASGGNNAERYLMCPGYCASPDGVLNDGFVIPTDSADNKIILSIHAYTPYNFALESPGIDNFIASSYTSTKDIDYFMDKIYSKYVSQGVPVLIGEGGCVDKNGNLQSRVDWASYYTAKARSCGLTFVWWDNGQFSGNGELFGLLDRKSGEVKYPEIMKAMLDNCN